MNIVTANKQNQKLEISKMLILSTAHITPETVNYLNNSNLEFPAIYEKSGLLGNYGWFIYTNYEPEEILKNNVPYELMEAMLFAKESRCDWLCLDSDGPICDCLFTFNWE